MHLSDPHRVHILHIAGLRRTPLLSRLANLSRGYTVALFHGGILVKELAAMDEKVRRRFAKQLDSFSELWCSNADLAAVVSSVAHSRTVRIVSPYSGHPPTDSRCRSRSLRGLLLAVGGDRDTYGVDFVLDSISEMRMAGSEINLTAVLYGPAESDEALFRDLARYPWVRVLTQQSPSAFSRELSISTAVLRPTITDGDSLLIREALSHGVRVLASDVVPRPCGVELFPLRSQAFQCALAYGGDPSRGEGLGPPLDEAVRCLLGARGE
jgi:glycogen(starch) synthase